MNIGHRDSRNISPSQVRCLTIAVEIINRPSLIFLEDPLFDLDWHHALVVSNAIKTLVSGGRTVVCTISKPSKYVTVFAFVIPHKMFISCCVCFVVLYV